MGRFRRKPTVAEQFAREQEARKREEEAAADGDTVKKNYSLGFHDASAGNADDAAAGANAGAAGGSQDAGAGNQPPGDAPQSQSEARRGSPIAELIVFSQQGFASLKPQFGRLYRLQFASKPHQYLLVRMDESLLVAESSGMAMKRDADVSVDHKLAEACFVDSYNYFLHVNPIGGVAGAGCCRLFDERFSRKKLLVLVGDDANNDDE